LKAEDDLIDMNILAPWEIELLIAHAPSEHRCLMRFLFLTGARFGEVCGLMWTDMDSKTRADTRTRACSSDQARTSSP
jgi:integrase